LRLDREMLDDFNRRAGERTTPLLRCCRGLARGLLLCLLFTFSALAAHLVGVPAVVTHHLKALIRNVLRDRRDEIARAEHLKVALDLRIQLLIVGEDKTDERGAVARNFQARTGDWIWFEGGGGLARWKSKS